MKEKMAAVGTVIFLFGLLLFLMGGIEAAVKKSDVREMKIGCPSASADKVIQPGRAEASEKSVETGRNGEIEASGKAETPGEPRKIALTFDDGPHPVYTPALLDGLKKRGVKASFFITGENAEQYPELVERMYREGHLIGNHTYSHIRLTKQNQEQFKEELIKTNGIISGITGEEIVFVRPPYGSWDKKFEEELNMFPVLWTIDPMDWCTRDADNVTRRVLSKAKENAVILMHDEYDSTVQAALSVVDALKGEGYEFVTVEEILFD